MTTYMTSNGYIDTSAQKGGNPGFPGCVEGIQLRFTVRDFTTSWQKLERGIVTGCTISPILFVIGMKIIMKAAERETMGPRMESGTYQSSNRGVYERPDNYYNIAHTGEVDTISTG